MRRILLAAALLVSTISAAGRAADVDVEKEIAKLSGRITTAVVKGDFSFLEEILADDWVMISPIGEIEGKKKHIADLKDGTMNYEALDKSDLKVRVYGDAAVVNGQLMAKVKFKGQSVGGPVCFTEVFVKQAGKWRSVSVQLTRVVPPTREKPGT